MSDAGLVRPVVGGMAVRAGDRTVVIMAIVVRSTMVFRISNAAGRMRACGRAERRFGL